MSRTAPEQRGRQGNRPYESPSRGFQGQFIPRPAAPGKGAVPTKETLNRFLDTEAPAAAKRPIHPKAEKLHTIKTGNAERFNSWKREGDAIRDNFDKHRDDHRGWFTQDFWRDHPNPWYRRPWEVNWWVPAAWGAVAVWLPWHWSEPIYYDYGEGGNVVYEDGTVQVDNEETYPADEYASQARELAGGTSSFDPATAKWLPLGVFALTDSERPSQSANMFLQLAVSKEGVLSGTFINSTTKAVSAVKGKVDKESQKAAWSVDGAGNGIIMETGLYNLTEDQTVVLVYFPGGTTQTWLMVRLEEPKG